MQRRFFYPLLVLISFILPTSPSAQTAAVEELVYGDKNAPITVIEYVSLTCIHCAQFHLQTFPEIKKAYIDTGKVKWILRDFPLDRAALHAAHLGQCFTSDRIRDFIDGLFHYQDNWIKAKDPEAALNRMAKLAGLSQDTLDACLADKAIEDRILSSRLEGMQKFGVDSTPSFIVNGKKLPGAVSFDALRQMIEQS